MRQPWPARILAAMAVLALGLGVWSAVEGAWAMAVFLWLFAVGQVPLLAHARGTGDRAS